MRTFLGVESHMKSEYCTSLYKKKELFLRKKKTYSQNASLESHSVVSLRPHTDEKRSAAEECSGLW